MAEERLEKTAKGEGSLKKGFSMSIGASLGCLAAVIGVLIIFGFIGGLFSGGGDTSNPTPSDQSNGAKQTEQKKFDVKAFYDQVQTGMSKQQVVGLAAKEPNSCTESQSEFGKYEWCSWNGSFGDSTFVSIGFHDDKVDNKGKTGF